MSAVQEFKGVVLLCDAAGSILRIERDGIGCSQRIHPGSPLRDLVEPGAREKLDLFLAELQAQDAAVDWEITVNVEQTLVPLHFAGGRANGAYVIVAAVSHLGMAQLHEQLMEINNEQANSLRAMAKGFAHSSTRGVEQDGLMYEEMGRLNNELTNLQRELAKKNAELERYILAAEHEQAIASELMSRMVRVDELRDPLLQSWIQPAHNLSGDLIAAGRTPSGVLHLLLADGTGHGLSASLCVLPMAEPFYAMTGKDMRVGAIAAEINRKLLAWLTAGRFVAAALISFDPATRLVEVWCGGLPPPFFLDAGGEPSFEFCSMHLPFGVLRSKEFDSTTESRRFEQPGQLIVCSDGVTEAAGVDGTLFGQERLLRSLGSAPPSQRLERLKLDLAAHVAGRPALDDMSVALIEFSPTS